MKDQVEPTGLASAVILASGIGCAVFGLCVVLAAASPAVSGFLNFYAAVGSLSGKSVVAVAAWLVSWAVLDTLWDGKEVDFSRVFAVTLVLVSLGLLATFPLIFGLFH